MPNTRGKSKVPAYSKKRKVIGTSSSSSLTATTHHRYLTFDQPHYEERYQHLRVISLGLGFGVTLGLYSDDFLETPEFSTLPWHIHRLTSLLSGPFGEQYVLLQLTQQNEDDEHLNDHLLPPPCPIPNPPASHSTAAPAHTRICQDFSISPPGVTPHDFDLPPT
ncbi:hypothetical protein Gorai_000370, partial [Gossypium raimondii]|nr:hypothetical protein [Gossypium raimondii]